MQRVLLAILALAAGTIGCKDKTPPATGTAPVTINVGHVGHDHQLALYVGALEGKRFERDYGVYLRQVKKHEVYDLVEDGQTLARLRLIRVGGGARMPAAMERGEIEIGLGGVAPVAKFADKGNPFKIICPLQTDGDMLAMRKDSPVVDWASFVSAAKSAEKPLNIGYKAPVAVAKLIFERALMAEQIPYSLQSGDPAAKVILMNMMSEASPVPMLSAGGIDGFVWNQPAVAVAVDKGVAKVIAELRDLPPRGKWANHPCCCVATRAETLAKHPHLCKAFLKVILLSTQLIQEDQGLAVRRASEWTKHSEAVEKLSIPTISYLGEPTESWMKGMETWVRMMQEVKAFEGKYAAASPADVVRDVCDMSLCVAAARELRKKGLLR